MISVVVPNHQSEQACHAYDDPYHLLEALGQTRHGSCVVGVEHSPQVLRVLRHGGFLPPLPPVLPRNTTTDSFFTMCVTNSVSLMNSSAKTTSILVNRLKNSGLRSHLRRRPWPASNDSERCRRQFGRVPSAIMKVADDRNHLGEHVLQQLSIHRVKSLREVDNARENRGELLPHQLMQSVDH